jgi:hypothetical protein
MHSVTHGVKGVAKLRTVALSYAKKVLVFVK